MKKQVTFLLILSVSLLTGQIPAGYYDNAQGLTGYQLKTALKQIIDNHTVYSYDDLYDIYVDSDTDHYYENDGTVLDMYSEKPSTADVYEYHHNQNTCGQYSGEGDCYNREHILPQSIFGSASPMKSDAHFVVPTDGYVNNRRSSYPFGVVNNPSWTSTNGSKLGSNSTQGYSGTVFEPIDEFKGDIARMLFYVATRYESRIASWGSSDMLDGTSDHVFSDWFLEILITWHNQDPVSQRERDRNDAIYSYQHNRNPFIDHPEWVAAIWDPSPDTQAPSVPANLHVTSVTDTSIQIAWDAATDDRGVTGYQIFVDNNMIGNVNDTQYQINSLSPDTTYQICVKAYDAANNFSNCSNNISVTTMSPYLLNETFDNCPSMQFVSVSEASNKDWTCINQYGENNSPAIQINGYQADTDCEDWLITASPVNFDNYQNERLSFFTVHKYGNTPLLLVYSTDYDGNGNPSDFTWTPVPNVNLPIPDGTNTEVTYPVSNADISGINGTAYLAFKYFTQTYQPTRWTVDSVTLSAESISYINNIASVKVKIYPNPAQKFFYIKTPVPIVSAALYDLSGKQININYHSDNQMVELKNISQGMYILQLETQKSIVSKRIVVK